MTSLTELSSYCLELESDKVTARKKAEESIALLLDTPRLRKTLDDNHNKNGVFTWTDLWKYTFRYTDKSAVKWIKDLERLNSKTNSNTALHYSKKAQVVHLMRIVLQKCDKCLIKADTIIDNLLSFLSSSPSCARVRQCFGADIVDIFLKRIFTSQIYLQRFRVKDDNDNQWQSLLRTAFEIFESSGSNIEDLSLQTSCEFLYHSIKEANIYSTCWKTISSKIPVFSQFLDQRKLQGASIDSKIVALKLTNLVQEILKHERRHQLCDLGERNGISIMALFEEGKTDTEIIQFFRIQLSLHHPQGAKTLAEGAYFVDQESWREHVLPRIYVNLIDTLIANKKRQNRLKGSKSFELHPEVVALAAAVSCQIFSTGSSQTSMDLTQIVPIDQTQINGSHQQQEPPSKKRKVDMSLKSCILDKLKRNINEDYEETMIPWLQILSLLIPKLEQELLHAVGKAIQEQMQSTRSASVKSLLLECAEKLLIAWPSYQSWPLIWEDCINTIKLNQCTESSHSLIRTMIRMGKCKDLQTSLLNLYSAKRIKCSEASIKTLAVALQLNPLSNQQQIGDILRWIMMDQHIYLVQTCPQSIIDVLLIVMVQHTQASNLRLEGELCKMEDGFVNLERDILELNQQLYPREAKSDPIQEALFKVTCVEKVKSTVKDYLIQQCGVVLDDLVKHPQELMRFEALLGYCRFIGIYLDRSRQLEIEAKRLEDVLVNMISRGGRILCQIIDECGKSLFKIANRVSPYLDAWIIWMKSMPGVSNLETIRDVNQKIGEVLVLIQKTRGVTGEKKQKKGDDIFMDSDEEEDTASMDYDDDEEQQQKNENLVKRCLTALGLMAASLSKNDFGDFKETLMKYEPELIFLAVESFLERCKDSELALECLPILQSLIRKITAPGLFDPYLMLLELKCLTKTIKHLEQHWSDVDETTRKNVLKFALGFIKLQEKFQRFSRDLEIGFLQFIFQLAKIDHWSMLDSKMYPLCSHNDDRLDSIDDDKVTLALILSKFTRNPSQKVRQMAINRLFKITMSREDTKHLSKSMESWSIMPSPAEMETGAGKDMKSNMIGSTLLLLTPMIVEKSSHDRLILVQLMTRLFIREKVNAKRMENAVETIAKHGLEMSPKVFMTFYLQHLMLDCLKNFSFEVFPFHLYGRTFDAFLSQHEAVLVPLLLWHFNCESSVLAKLTKATHKKDKVLFIDNFVQLAAIYWPDQSDSRSLKLYKTTEEIVGLEKHKELLNDFFPQIFGQILLRIEDYNHLSKAFGFEVMEAETSLVYPGLSFAKIQKFALEIKRNLDDDKDQGFWNQLVKFNPDTLQKLMTQVCRPLKRQLMTDTSAIMSSLHGLYVVIDMIATELSSSHRHLQKSLPFVSWFVGSALINLLNVNKDVHLVAMSLTVIPRLIVFHSLEDDWTSSDSVMSKLVLPLTNTLVDKYLEYEGTSTAVKALDILKLIILENRHKLTSDNFIRLLGPFPRQRPDFKDIIDVTNGQLRVIMDKNEAINLSKSLVDEMTDFVRKTEHRKENLQVLLSKLKDSTSEVLALIKQLPTMGFSEDANKSLLHRTIKCLIDLSLKPSFRDDNDEIRLLSQECLGYLGPLDLNTMTLYPEKVHPVQSELVTELADYITSNDAEVSEAAIFGLKRVFCASSPSLESLGPHLHPFNKALTQCTSSKGHFQLVKGDVEGAVLAAQWWPVDGKHKLHREWIMDLVSCLLNAYPIVKDGYLSKASVMGRHLLPLASKESRFCSKLFPWLVQDILQRDGCPLLSKAICDFFAQAFGTKLLQLDCLETMLDVVNYCRRQSRDLGTPWHDNFWINGLNYLHVAFAASLCSKHVDAVIYCDIWCQETLGQDQNLTSQFSVECLSKSLLDTLYDHHAANGNGMEDIKTCQNLLAEAYTALGENAAILGCGSNRILDFNAQIQQLMRERDHAKAMVMYDSCLSLDQSLRHHQEYQLGLLDAMQEASLEHTLSQFQKTCHEHLRAWDNDFEESKDLLLKRSDNFMLKMSQTSKAVKLQPRVMSSLYSSLSKWKALQEMKTIQQVIDIEKKEECSVEKLFSCGFMDFGTEDYKHIKFILVNRCKILAQLPFLQLDETSNSPQKQRRIRMNQIKTASLTAFVDNSLKLCRLGCDNEDYHLVFKHLSLIDHVKNKCQNTLLDKTTWQKIEDRINYQRARLFWSWGEKDMAKMQMQHLIQQMTKQESSELLPEVLGLMGSWLWTLRSESAGSILENYLKKSIALYELNLDKFEKAKNMDKSLKAAQDISEAYNKLGTFCDEQYIHTLNYINSKDFEDKQAILEKISQENKLRKKEGLTKEGDARTTAVIMERNSNIDKREVSAKQEEKINYLILALENYANALIKSDKHDLKINRWISLWFSNMDEDRVNNIVQANINLIPEYKFVGLLYQLCARMVTKKESKFASILTSLIFKCAQQHPYHTLPIVLALANSNADEKVQSSKALDAEENDRSKAAKEIILKLKNLSPNVSDLVNKTETMSMALIHLAYTAPPKASTAAKHKISGNAQLLRLKHMEKVLLPTHTLKIDKSGNYLTSEGFCGVAHFESTYSMVGGINAPKKISCIGTDGKARPQLLKGKDDLRQDAVMQQVFGLMNRLLLKSKLSMRTFKVVPLSQRSGILEWCVNTEPFSDFLVGPDRASGAHKRYHPSDWNAKQCQDSMKNTTAKCIELMRTRKATEAQCKKLRIDNFLTICKKLRPVFRHFFYENFTTSCAHLERRLAFTRSCATSSMIGYILGLGDRHVQNVLIDKHTAEVIHIDLGIAFEQGKILPTPETIPFRLTRDIIDGFGPCGVEGTFRKCAEDTLKVLRSNKESILTILEVLMFDPLYNWSLTPAKAYKLQFGREPPTALRKQWESTEQNTNKLAERALLRVTQKLNGVEEGSHLSVQGQVTSLIQQATDPQNLALVYFGWQPYL